MFNCIRVSNCIEISERRGTAISNLQRRQFSFPFGQTKKKEEKKKEVTLFRIIINVVLLIYPTKCRIRWLVFFTEQEHKQRICQ